MVKKIFLLFKLARLRCFVLALQAASHPPSRMYCALLAGRWLQGGEPASSMGLGLAPSRVITVCGTGGLSCWKGTSA